MQEIIFQELKEGMEKAISAVEKSFSKVRTGRASLSLLEGIRVDYYGTPTPINQVASLSIPESRLIVISPWDSSVLGAIEKAIQKSDLGLMPNNDGKLIRLAIPVLTEERRRELVKIVKKMAEECKVKQRNVRREANEKLKALKKDNQISEDELYTFQDIEHQFGQRNGDNLDVLHHLAELDGIKKEAIQVAAMAFKVWEMASKEWHDTAPSQGNEESEG